MDCSNVTYRGVPVSDECKTFRSTSSCLLHISPGDMALLPIWITSGSCFALIHPGTNDVPPGAPSRSRSRAIPSTSRACIYPRVYFISFLPEYREPIESFLISDENAIATSYESSQSAGGAALPGLTLFPLSFSSAQILRWFTAASDGNGVI